MNDDEGTIHPHKNRLRSSEMTLEGKESTVVKGSPRLNGVEIKFSRQMETWCCTNKGVCMYIQQHQTVTCIAFGSIGWIILQ